MNNEVQFVGNPNEQQNNAPKIVKTDVGNICIFI